MKPKLLASYEECGLDTASALPHGTWALAGEQPHLRQDSPPLPSSPLLLPAPELCDPQPLTPHSIISLG